jgi:hypothetical protein
MLAHLEHPAAHWLHIAQIAQLSFAQPHNQTAEGRAIPNAGKPCVEFRGCA